jgi:hypothetical protein
VLSMTIPIIDASSEKNLSTLSLEMFGDEFDLDDNGSETQRSQIERMFLMLHSSLLGSFHTEYLTFGAPSRKSIDEIVHDEDYSILHRCIHALGTGYKLQGAREMNGARWANLRASTFAASDIIRNCAEHTTGVLKKLIGNQLVANPVSQSLNKILNKIGIAPSKQQYRLKDILKSEQTMLGGLTGLLDPHDMWLMLYDNIGFRVCGSAPGWKQFVAIQLVRIRKERAKELNLYQKDQSQPAVSRVRKNWEIERESASFDDVFGIEEDDISNLARTAMGPIEMLIEMELEGKLPTIDQAFELVKHGRDFDWPAAASGKGEDEVIEKGVSVSIDNDEGAGVDTTSPFESNYDASDVHVDRPMAKDLNGAEAVEDLMEYALQMMKQVVGSKINDEEWKDVTKLMDEFGVALCGDGNPTFIMNNMIKKQQGKYGGKVSSFFGGFHLILEAHRKRGGLFGKSHLEDVFSSWRTSIGQLKWVLNPGDPNQIDAELVMYILGMDVAALRSLIKGRGPGAVTISAADVVDHMIQRSEQYPIIMVILIEIRYAEVIFMLHQAEKQGDVSKFITAMKYLTPMFTAAHATKYTSMAADFLVEWFCKSDAERIIFAEFIFTRKTKNGSNIYTDRFVEWMMKDIRTWCGNVATSNTSSFLEICALGLKDRVESKLFGAKEFKPKRNKTSKEEARKLKIDHVFCEVLVFCEEANLFGPGPVKHIKKGPSKNFERGGRQLGMGEYLPSTNRVYLFTALGSIVFSITSKTFLLTATLQILVGVKRTLN